MGQLRDKSAKRKQDGSLAESNGVRQVSLQCNGERDKERESYETGMMGK